MPFKRKFPENCRHLDLATVSRLLAKHRLNVCDAARELGVSRKDLSQLTRYDPKLLNEAREVIELYVARCHGRMIEELDSPERWRRRRAREQLLAAYDHPLAAAPKPPKPKGGPWSAFVVEMDRQYAIKKRAALATTAAGVIS